MTTDAPAFDGPPWRLSGTVVAALVNHRPLWLELGDAAFALPYKSPPQSPVLAVLPRHTQVFAGRPIPVPLAMPVEQDVGHAAPKTSSTMDSVMSGADEGGQEVEIGVALGMVIGRTASRVPAASALGFVAGYLVVGELSLAAPAGSPAHYRPGARLRARDGFCPMGDRVVPAHAVPDPDALTARVEIDGLLAQATDTADRVRGAAQLLADVSAFMTLQPGDVLTLGRSHPPPRARAGQRIRLSIDGVDAI